MNDLQSDILKKILEISDQTKAKLGEMNDEIKSLDKRLELHIQKTEYATEQLKRIDETQGEILKEYKNRTESIGSELQELSVDFSARLDELETKTEELAEVEEKIKKLEKPQEFIKTLGSTILVIASILGALYTIYEFIIRAKG